MKEKKLTFSKLPYIAGQLCMSEYTADTYMCGYQRSYANAVVRRFKRTVKAGGAGFECYVVIARRKS